MSQVVACHASNCFIVIALSSVFDSSHTHSLPYCFLDCAPSPACIWQVTVLIHLAECRKSESWHENDSKVVNIGNVTFTHALVVPAHCTSCKGFYQLNIYFALTCDNRYSHYYSRRLTSLTHDLLGCCGGSQRFTNYMPLTPSLPQHHHLYCHHQRGDWGTCPALANWGAAPSSPAEVSPPVAGQLGPFFLWLMVRVHSWYCQSHMQLAEVHWHGK